jgi:hypothetical protein
MGIRMLPCMVPKRHFLLALAVLTFPARGQVSLVAPADGGTPRDPKRIVQVGAHEFFIRALAEEGRGPLTHPVSRMDLLCGNAGTQSVTLTLRVDLSGDGTRTNRPGAPWDEMERRDYLYVQAPSQTWRRVDGAVTGMVCTVSFAASPGDTKVGLSPWYPYADYLRFVQSLPVHPHLQKERIGLSDGGREHWELTIADPAIPAGQKRRILWHAREHAYETFSSFAMEGLVDYLLSPEAAEARRRFLFAIQPMVNPDGVAQGFEYRAGYDYPQPRGTATARLTFAAVDRLRPDFVVAWHNWIAPRDVDVAFYTDGESDKPSRRAWDLFTQRFPSPRAVGHRWENETQPLAKNWFGRQLGEGNVHQYAMKRYGTKVWGWEMPWWGRDEGDPIQHARKAGADFARAFLATVQEIDAGGSSKPQPEGVNSTETPEVPRWQMHEFELHGRCHVENSFRDAALVGEFISPSGRSVIVEGFHDGGDTWRLRFAPDETGQWRYLLRGEGVELLQRGQLRCVAPHGHGFIGLHPENPYAFAYADGTAFFPMGDTCYGLFDDSPISPALRREYVETRRRQHFNFVRMTVGHSEARAARDPTFWAWGGTSAKPDLDRFNPAFFRGFDELLRELQMRGMNIELILFNFYRRPFTDTSLWTPARERLWLRYVLARYAAFNHVFLWTLANEYETHPDGRYRLDRPGDVDWVHATARLVKQYDSFRHLVTVHPVVSASARGASPRDPFDPPWRIGPFFGADSNIDVLSQQTSAAYAKQWDAGGQRWIHSCAAEPPDPWFTVQWNDALGCWTGDVPGVNRSVAADRIHGKPVLNTENGYEYLPGHPTERRQVHHTDKVRRTAWRITCAGGYFAAGFHGTIGHSDAWNRIDAPHRYTFAVQDAGAAVQLSALYEFLTTLPFWRMQPFEGVAGAKALSLAEPGKVYVAYLPQGGGITMDLGACRGELAARWFNPRTGKLDDPFQVAGGKTARFKAPDGEDWVLRVNAPVQ